MNALNANGRWLVVALVVASLLLALSACGPSEGLVHEGVTGKVTLKTTPWPPAARVLSRFEVELEPRGEGIAPDELVLVLGMPHMHHPDTLVGLEYASGRYRGSGIIDHGGTWHLRIQDEAGTTLASFEVEVKP